MAKKKKKKPEEKNTKPNKKKNKWPGKESDYISPGGWQTLGGKK